MIGPPRVAPNCWYFVSGFTEAAEAKEFLAWVDSLFAKAKTLPLNWLVPDFMTTVVTDPPARPNSASKFDVVTLTESIASAEGMRTVRRPVRWLLSSPSICTLFERRDWPLNLVSWESWGLKNCECGRLRVTDPGTVAHMPWKLRLSPRGSSWTNRPSMLRPVSARSVWRSGVSWTTSTVSVMAPTSRMTSTRIVELTFTSMPSRENFLKPLSSVSTR